MSASEFASVVAYLRIVKSGLASRDNYREALSTADLDEALSVFRDTLFREVASARDVRSVEETVWKTYLNIARKTVNLTAKSRRSVPLYYIRSEEARDLLALAQSIASGTRIGEGLPTAYVEWSLTSRVLQEAEALTSLQRLIDAVSERWAVRMLEDANRFHQESRLPNSFQLYTMRALVELARESLEGLRPNEAKGVERVLCPRLSYTLGSGLITAKRSGIESRVVAALIPPAGICGFEAQRLRQVYEREADALSLAYALRESLPYFSGEGKSVESILENARASALKRAYQESLAHMASYPFTPGFVAAGLELLRVNAESVLIIARSLMLGLKPHEYSGKLVIQD